VLPPSWTVSDPPVATVLQWWDANARPLPWRGTRDVYGVWVSEVMSAQTQVEQSGAGVVGVDAAMADGAGAGGGAAGRRPGAVAGARLSAAGT
jgi:hypothetical protein